MHKQWREILWLTLMRLEPVNSQSRKCGYLLKTSNASQLLPTLRILFNNFPFPSVHVLSKENKCSTGPTKTQCEGWICCLKSNTDLHSLTWMTLGFLPFWIIHTTAPLMGTDNRVLTTLHAIKFKIFVQQLYGFIRPNGAVRISCVLISTA